MSKFCADLLKTVVMHKEQKTHTYIRLGCTAVLASNNGLNCYRYTWSGMVGPSVCMIATFVIPAKTAESIKMPFGG